MRLGHDSVFCFPVGKLWWHRFQIDTRSHSMRRANQRKDMMHKFITALVNESYTTKTGSRCQLIQASSPKGRAGFGMRGWTCCQCGAVHDRDVNTARNILARGHERLAGGIPPKSCSPCPKPCRGVLWPSARCVLSPKKEGGRRIANQESKRRGGCQNEEGSEPHKKGQRHNPAGMPSKHALSAMPEASDRASRALLRRADLRP